MARPPITRKNPYTPKSGKVAGITFTSERQYRNALAREKGFTSWSGQQRQARKVRDTSDVNKLRPSERQARARALDALSRMRNDGLSLSAAAKEAGTTVNAVKRHAGSALTKTSGRFTAKRMDRLARAMRFPTDDGLITLEIRDSRTATRISAYWHAVRAYLHTGDTSRLRAFRGKKIHVQKRAYFFVTDPTTLDRLFDAGELDIDDLYDMREAA